MPEIYFPYMNIALDAFALLVTLIVLASCFQEFWNQTVKTKHFLFLLCSVIVALIADIVSWVGGRQRFALYDDRDFQHRRVVRGASGDLLLYGIPQGESLRKQSRGIGDLKDLSRAVCLLDALFHRKRFLWICVFAQSSKSLASNRECRNGDCLSCLSHPFVFCHRLDGGICTKIDKN